MRLLKLASPPCPVHIVLGLFLVLGLILCWNQPCLHRPPVPCRAERCSEIEIRVPPAYCHLLLHCSRVLSEDEGWGGWGRDVSECACASLLHQPVENCVCTWIPQFRSSAPGLTPVFSFCIFVTPLSRMRNPGLSTLISLLA